MLTSDKISSQKLHIRVVISNFIYKEKTHFNFTYYIFKYTIFLLQCGGKLYISSSGPFWVFLLDAVGPPLSMLVLVAMSPCCRFRSVHVAWMHIYIHNGKKAIKNSIPKVRDAVCISKPPALHFFLGSCWVSHLRARGNAL